MSESNTGAASAGAQSNTSITSNSPATEAVEAAESAIAEMEAEDTSDESADDESAEEVEQPAPVSKYKVKIDGQEVELGLDDLKKYASMGKAAQKRMEEAANVRKENDTLKKEIQTFFEMLKSDPLSILQDDSLGLDVKKLAEEVMNKEIERAKKSPEQLEIERLQKELEGKNKREKELEDNKKRSEYEKMQNEAAASIEKDILEALETKELPKSPYVMNRMIGMMHLAAKEGIKLTAKDVLPIVKKQIHEDFKNVSGLMPEEQLEAILGEDKVKALRKRYLAKVKQTQSAKDIKSTGGDVQSSNNQKSKQAVNARDFFKKLGSL